MSLGLKTMNHFDNDKTQVQYMLLMKEHTPKMHEHLWSKELVAKHIIHVHKIKMIEQLDHSRSENYSVDIVDSRETLYLNGLEVVPWEDCFDIIVQVHRKLGHRGEWRFTYAEVSKKYVVSPVCVMNVMRACNVCTAYNHILSSLKGPKSFNKSCQVFTLSMALTPDPPFTTILVLVDCLTSFVHLKPIISLEEQHILPELLKIFTDFGAPTQMETSEVSLYRRVCDSIENMLGITITIVSSNKIKMRKFWRSRTAVLLKEWLETSGSERWSTGCHIVQWQMNNTIMKGETAHKLVFSKSKALI